MRSRFHGAISILAVVCVVGVASSRIVPSLDLRALVSEAELIAAGRVIAVRSDRPEAPITVEVDAVRVLKGRHPTGSLVFRSGPPEMSGLAGPIAVSRFGMFFLRTTQDGKQSVNDYYPVLPAAESSAPVAGQPLDRVVGELAQLLEAPETLDQDFRVLAYVLQNVHHPSIMSSLRRAASRDDTRGLLAASELLRRGDVSTLSKAERVLIAQTHYDPAVKTALGESLEAIRDPNAVPALSRLLRFGGAETRRAAATALGNTRSRNGLPVLGEALYDPDQEVRYRAVIALEKIRRQGHWAMSFEYFEEQEEQLLQFWRNWVKTTAKPPAN